MAEKLTRLELTWPGKDERFNPEPRILLEDENKSYAKDAPQAGKTGLFDEDEGVPPTFDNMLIHGDNLLALKALEQDYTGKIKCIYIDPPYNTGNAFEHYDDGLEHSIWLSMMRERLEILRTLLKDDGVIFVHIDNNEQAYLKVLMDEIFGRKNFIDTLIPIMNPRGNQANKHIATTHEYIHIYGKNIDVAKLYGISLSDDMKKEYSKSDMYGLYREIGLRKRGAGARREDAPNQYFPIYYKLKTNEIFINDKEDCIKILPKLSDGSDGRWRWSYKSVQEKSWKLIVRKVNRNGSFEYDVFEKDYLTEDKTTKIKSVLDESGINNEIGTRHIKSLGIKFDNPKSEILIQKVIEISTTPGDLVLDSFLGSGTTAAVAQKMGRRWIGIEMGDHVYTHCIPRLTKVINGEDQGGITKAVNYKGGGGFKFYELASSLIVKDKYGQQIISEKYNPEMLAEAMCKIMGYKYAPDKEIYWKQGYSSEKNYIYTTTANLQETSLDRIASEIGDSNLLICCSAFIGNTKAYPNISVKKIPAAILKKCEWGKEGYPLLLSNYHPDDEVFEFDEGE